MQSQAGWERSAKRQRRPECRCENLRPTTVYQLMIPLMSSRAAPAERRAVRVESWHQALVLTLLVAACYAGLVALPHSKRMVITDEDGVVELLGALGFLLTAGLMVLAFLRAEGSRIQRQAIVLREHVGPLPVCGR